MDNYLHELFINDVKRLLVGMNIGDNNGSFEDGRQKAYDDFWDVYQMNGERVDYIYAFGGLGWTDDTFKPKYPFPEGPAKYSYMFSKSKITDISKLPRLFCEECMNMFTRSSVTHVNELEIKCELKSFTNSVFSSCSQLHTINKLIILMPDSINIDVNMFTACNSLKNITIEGVIPSGINMQWSPLSVVSMKSVITHLKDYSGTDKVGVNSIVFSDACWTALEADSTSPVGGTWKEYVESLGWLC